MRAPSRARWVPGILALIALLTPSLARAAEADPLPADSVLIWNDQTNRAIQTTNTDAFLASRALALESIAVLDTLRSIAGTPGYLVRLPAQSDTKANVAVAAAAHTMLRHLFPARQAALDTALTASLANEPAGPSRDRAVAFGAAVADAVFAVRDRDGWNAAPSAPPPETASGPGPGQWRPTPSEFLAPMEPQWAKLTPFAMTAPGQFRPAGPPDLTAAAFRDATAAVRTIGEKRSATRTPVQTEIAHYWSDAIGTYAPAGHWNAITATLAAPMGLGLNAEAEVFAELNIAMADAGIAMADAKYTYWFWRPITVIRLGGDGSAPDPNWSPLLETPNHPSYISGHSSFSGAAAVVLTARFGNRPFSFVSASIPGVTRTFTSFQQAAEEAAMSRVYGGIHFSFDNVDGLATGRSAGAWTLSAFRRIAEDRGPVIVMDGATGMTRSTRGQAGFALDNASPVTAVTIRPIGGAPFSVSVDNRGRFTIPRQRAGSIRPRELVMTARTAAGRTTTAKLEIDDPGGLETAPLSVK